VTVLAGTVRRPDQVDAALAAGAQAIVSPGLSHAVVSRARELGAPAIPGALTPTEIEAAWAAGAALVKLFPAGLGGPSYVRDVLASATSRCSSRAGSMRATHARSSTPARSRSVRGRLSTIQRKRADSSTSFVLPSARRDQ
jgi:2-keto-3-deoxy-6-phosphogluconate aldolase